MRNPLRSPAAVSIGLLLLRLPIGMIFINAGFIKIRGGIGDFATKSLSLLPSYVPGPLGKAYLYALPLVELLVGVLLILGWFTRMTAFVTALILISIMMALNGFWEGAMWVPNSTAVLLSIALMLMLTGPGAYAVDSIPFGRVSRKPPAE